MEKKTKEKEETAELLDQLYDQIYELEKRVGLHNTEAFRRGKAAAKLGIPIEDNPYDYYEATRDWRDGWETQISEQENQN